MRSAIALALMVGCSTAPAAEDGAQGAWAFTAGFQADDQDARAVQAGLSYALSDVARSSADAGFTRQATPPGELAIRTQSVGLGLDYDFGRLGIQADVDYWGDPGELTRNGFVAGLYTSTDSTRLSLQGYYRDFTLTARIPDDQGNLSDVRDFNMSATGIGSALRISNDRWFGGVRAAWFDYSRDPRSLSITRGVPRVELVRTDTGQ